MSHLKIRYSVWLHYLAHQYPTLFRVCLFFSDSLYIKAFKKSVDDINHSVQQFKELHTLNPNDNLNIIELLRCPKTGNNIQLSEDKQRAISNGAGIYYPVVDGIPIMIATEARSL